MARETLVARGLTSLIRDFKTFDRPVNRELRQSLRDVGDVVKRDAQTSFAHVNARSAAGFKTRVRQRGIAVGQSIRRTTGQHPEYGSLQMRHLIRAQRRNEDELYRELERALDRISRKFERRK